MNRRAVLVIAVVALGVPLALRGEAALKAERIVISKSARTVTIVYSPGVAAPVILSDARFGAGRLDGPKREQGDQRTPEGLYHVAEVRRSGGFIYLPALLLSYPNADDRAAAAARGVSPGGAILIHSPPDDWTSEAQPDGDWTDGCIALTRAQLRLVVDAAWAGVPVEIER